VPEIPRERKIYTFLVCRNSSPVEKEFHPDPDILVFVRGKIPI
jgi:hypothetical protein